MSRASSLRGARAIQKNLEVIALIWTDWQERTLVAQVYACARTGGSLFHPVKLCRAGTARPSN